MIDDDPRGSSFNKERNNDINTKKEENIIDLSIPIFITKVFLPESLSPFISGIFASMITAVNKVKLIKLF